MLSFFLGEVQAEPAGYPCVAEGEDHPVFDCHHHPLIRPVVIVPVNHAPATPKAIQYQSSCMGPIDPGISPPGDMFAMVTRITRRAAHPRLQMSSVLFMFP